MGFISNVLEYGWNAGCIITEAERTADRICKGIKTTIIPDEEEKEEQTNLDRAEEKDDGEDYNFRIIFHPEWLPKEMRERVERMQQEEHSEHEAIGNIMDAHTDTMSDLSGRMENNAGDGENIDTGGDDIV